MTIDKEKLKPCPFCGGQVQLETVKSRAGTLYGVVCRNTGNRGCTCAMEQVPSRSAEAAIARWNMRKPEEALHAQLSQCEAMAMMVAEREWAEHVGTGPVSSKVEVAFTQLHNELQEAQGKLADLEALRKDAERYRWLSQVSTMADKLSPGTVDHAMMLHQAMERVEIPDFTPGNGNNARRRAEELGIDYNAATSIQVKE